MLSYFTKCKVVGDVLLVCLALAPTIYLEYRKDPFNGGFYCSDKSINHTYHGETYPCWTLLVIALPVPIFLILLTETLTTGSRYRTLTTYLFGLFSSVSLMEFLKFAVGRPRPLFMKWCQPILPDGTNCSDPKNFNMFVESFTCANSNAFLRLQSRLSFPSGHACISTYALIFLAIYFNFRMTSKGSLLFKYVLQLVCVTLAASVSVSRITDHMHFWSDVIVGVFIGTSFAVWTTFIVSDLTKNKNQAWNLKNAGSTSDV